MKKTYMTPAIEVVKMNVQGNMMLVASGNTNETSGNLSREVGLPWDEE